MQYTESITSCPKGNDEAGIPEADVKTVLEQVNDPRRKQGTRFSLASMLLLALAAMLSNHVWELAIAQWGAAQSDEVKQALGFHKGVTPHQTTIQRLFRRLSADELEAAFRDLFGQLVDSGQKERGACAVSIDGKAQRGRLKFEEEGTYPVHAVSLVDHQTGIVLMQGHVQRTDTLTENELAQTESQTKGKQPSPRKKSKRAEDQEKKEQEEQKMKSELAVASRLLKHIDWKGKVLTGDALYCQRCLCHALRLAGGDYLFLVKGNQPQLLEDIGLLFAPPEPAKRAGEGMVRLPEQHAQSAETGHGRVDIRRLRVSSELKGYSDWPG